ncbi:UNVERIFIED_CONTAM: protein BLISTER [Sesamum radiatum]|uniref:Protein BLISTER n=1 Tax=Sesamum radiatum TaxID=300843 RepID=A0AAW2UCR9_SESRA
MALRRIFHVVIWAHLLFTDVLTKSSVSALLVDKLGNRGHEDKSLMSSPYQAGRRNRPSFLDSIQIAKGPLSSPPLFGAEKADTLKPKVFPVDGLESSVSQRSANSSVAAGDGVGLFNHVSESKYDFFPSKQNDDFAALEQHIEDLTQEKFSLQRALEASRALAESLASENSALTESFNQQGSVVNQLKSDLEKLQEEIKAQLVELEAVKREYANAQMECNAADERAKLLASEVIELEEKALRLRSNELKLERQLENTQAEISSYRKKMVSLEKDRQDLQSTIDALQEEKKLLQSKLRKASSSGNSIDLSKTSRAKHDVSTSTEDLATACSQPLLHIKMFYSGEKGGGAGSRLSQNLETQKSGTALPVDDALVLRFHMKIYISVLKLALEKDQLTRALAAESSQSSQLLELNKELTRKLEAQTQRLELLTAQSMVNDNTQPRQLDSRAVHENTTYADEGDEVVERVLGWIMKLFPGGPSRRRPSKHL